MSLADSEGVLFGPDVSEEFCKDNDLLCCIRSHEAQLASGSRFGNQRVPLQFPEEEVNRPIRALAEAASRTGSMV